jgi:hypothetical protein
MKQQKIFIGSSGEGQDVCDALLTQLNKKFDVVPWHISFPPSLTSIEALLEGLATFQFGIFVMSADDRAKVRDKDVVLPRDNVLFEAGLFMGMHGLRRTFFVCPNKPDNFHLMSDLKGVTFLPYDPDAQNDGWVVSIARSITQAIAKENRDALNVQVEALTLKQASAPNLVWPVKVQLRVKNATAAPVTLQSLAFQFANARPARNDYVLGGRVHNVAFRRWIAPGGKNHDQYHEVVVLYPGEEVEAWIALDASYTDEELRTLQDRKEIGTWRYRTTWHQEVPRTYDHELSL